MVELDENVELNVDASTEEKPDADYSAKDLQVLEGLEAVRKRPIDVKQSKQKLNEQRIIAVVADYYNKTPSQITSTSRQGDLVFARHIAMYLIRKMLDTPYTKIGMVCIRR